MYIRLVYRITNLNVRENTFSEGLKMRNSFDAKLKGFTVFYSFNYFQLHKIRKIKGTKFNGFTVLLCHVEFVLVIRIKLIIKGSMQLYALIDYNLSVNYVLTYCIRM